MKFNFQTTIRYRKNGKPFEKRYSSMQIADSEHLARRKELLSWLAVGYQVVSIDLAKTKKSSL